MKTSITSGQLSKLLTLAEYHHMTPERFQALIEKGFLSALFDERALYPSTDAFKAALALQSQPGMPLEFTLNSRHALFRNPSVALDAFFKEHPKFRITSRFQERFLSAEALEKESRKSRLEECCISLYDADAESFFRDSDIAQGLKAIGQKAEFTLSMLVDMLIMQSWDRKLLAEQNFNTLFIDRRKVLVMNMGSHWSIDTPAVPMSNLETRLFSWTT